MSELLLYYGGWNGGVWGAFDAGTRGHCCDLSSAIDLLNGGSIFHYSLKQEMPPPFKRGLHYLSSYLATSG